jgi:hypothetical protein
MHGGMEGGYAYIDSSYPRRPGDFARLSSMEFDATGAVLRPQSSENNLLTCALRDIQHSSPEP